MVENASALAAIVRQPQVRGLFDAFLDKLDAKPFAERSKRLFVRALESPLEALRHPSTPGEDDLTWGWIERLAAEGILVLRYPRRRRPNDPPWAGCEIEFPPQSETSVREWLARPVISPAGRAWRMAVSSRCAHFVDPELAAQQPLQVPGMTPEAVIERLIGLPGCVRERPLTARQIAARLFDGDSKVLEGREEWLQRIFGLDERRILPRGLIVEAHLPAEDVWQGVLLIENLDSYLEAMAGHWPQTEGLALVYTAGFRATASRVRAAARLHFSGEGGHDKRQRFSQAWYTEGPLPWPTYFCGDLDWEGLRIFQRLRDAFPGIEPWRPGYERMLAARQAGIAHKAEAAGKGDQRPLECVGHDWLDARVVRELNKDPRFVDQEVISNGVF